MTIDPTTCKPGEAYLVTLRNGRTTVGLRLDANEPQWLVPFNGNLVWCADTQIAKLHRLVPEPKEKVLDVLTQPWELVRATRQVLIDHDRYTDGDWMTERLEAEAANLEREHRAAQEKAAADVAREALIVKAASVTVTHPNGAVVSVGLPYACALADAGYLTEPVETTQCGEPFETWSKRPLVCTQPREHAGPHASVTKPEAVQS